MGKTFDSVGEEIFWLDFGDFHEGKESEGANNEFKYFVHYLYK